MNKSSILKGLAILVLSCLAGLPGAALANQGSNAVPYGESFEVYSNDYSIFGQLGWYYGSSNDIGSITTLSYSASAPPPLPAQTHTNVLYFETSSGSAGITNRFTSDDMANSNVYLEVMLKPGHMDAEESPLVRNVTNDCLMAAFVDTNGYLNIWHAYYNEELADFRWRWITNKDMVIGTSDWVRLTITLKLNPADLTMGFPFFRIAVNGGTAITNDDAYTSWTIDDPTTNAGFRGGSWFFTPLQSDRLKALSLGGMGMVDDVKAEFGEPVDIYVFPEVKHADGSSATAHATNVPASSYTVMGGNNGTNTFYSYLDWYIADVRTNTPGSPLVFTSLGDPAFGAGLTNYTYTCTGILNSTTLRATIAPEMAASNTPRWWLRQYGLTSWAVDATNDNDTDGLYTWQEYILGSDPTNALSAWYSIDATIANTNGSISPSNRVYDFPSNYVWVQRGTTINFTNQANTGYTIKLGVDGVTNSYSTNLMVRGFTNVTANHSILAEFVVGNTNRLLITRSAGAGGTVTPTTNIYVNYGDNASFSVQASANYHIFEVVVDNVTNSAFGQGSNTYQYAFNNVITDHTFGATFELDKYTLQIASAHGTPNPVGVGTYTNYYGTKLTNTLADAIQEANGTQFVWTGWMLTGNLDDSAQPSGAGTNVILTLTNNAVLTWGWNTYYQFFATGAHCQVGGSTNGYYLAGSSVTVTGIPDAHYGTFYGWTGLVAGLTVNTNVLSIPSMDQVRSVGADFFLDKHTLTIASDHGTPNPLAAGVYTNDYGTWLTNSLANTTQSADGTQFVYSTWALVGNLNDGGNPNGAATNVILQLTNNAVLTWAWITNVQLTANAVNGTISPDPSGWILRNSSITVTSVANAHASTFLAWSGQVSGLTTTATELVIASLDQTRSVTANYQMDKHTLTISSDHGSPNPIAGIYTNDYGTTLTNFLANASQEGDGTQFVGNGWALVGNLNGGGQPTGTGTNVTLTLTNNASLTWLWITNVYLDASSVNGSINPDPSGWILRNSSITVTSVPGAHANTFLGWSGDVSGLTTTAVELIIATLDRTRAVVANYRIDKHTLQIVSDHGAPNPVVGIYTNDYNTPLTNTLAGTPDQNGRTQYVGLGWALTGNLSQGGAAAGAGTNLLMTLTNNAVLVWTWTTNYQFYATAEAHGQVTGGTNGSGWYQEGSSVTVTGVPDAYYQFAAWNGEVAGLAAGASPVVVTMTVPRSISATFSAITEALGTPQPWMVQYGITTDFNVAETNDPDRDGLLTWQEYITGTDPTDRWSSLRFTVEQAGLGTNVVRWIGSTNTLLTPYSVWVNTNVSKPGSWAVTSIQARVHGTNAWTNVFHPVSGRLFYKVTVTN